MQRVQDIAPRMGIGFTSLSGLLAHGYDSLIDVRSPAEFADDHIPGAINLPVLSNDERARVGTVYKQQSPFLARKIGAALVFRNAAAHIDGPLAQHEGAWRPLVYCWRGGQRSGSFAWMLREIGWRADTVAGGYQSFRRLVHATLYDDAPLPWRLVLLDGNTGTAKTEVLHALAQRGVQTLDLEGLARHRGSLLGAQGRQPAQRMFETGIACALAQMDPARPVVIEAESNKIGARVIPPRLSRAMRPAPRIELSAPLAARAAYLMRAYDDILSDGDRLRRQLTPLHAHRGWSAVQHWFALIEAGDKLGLTQALMRDHYDPAYAKSRSRREGTVISALQSQGLAPADIEDFAARIERVLDQLATDTIPV